MMLRKCLLAPFFPYWNHQIRLTLRSIFSFSLLILYLSSLANGPSHLLETLNGIKKDHREIVKQVEELKEAQNAFVTEILKDLNKLEEAESRLVAKIGGEETLQKE
jgi:hypothetical protein